MRDAGGPGYTRRQWAEARLAEANPALDPSARAMNRAERGVGSRLGRQITGGLQKRAVR